MPEIGYLRVWWVPQVPMQPFHVPVADETQAKLIIETLGAYDAFQFENKVKPDYANMGGLEEFTEDGEWSEWTDLNGDDIHEWMDRH